MFVRWKRRERVKRRRGKTLATGRFLLSAVLVRSERRGGRPRQAIVAYLGSLNEDWLNSSVARDRFWQLAAERLDRIPLTPAERQEVERQVRQRVPPPDHKEIEAWRRSLAEVEAALRPDSHP